MKISVSKKHKSGSLENLNTFASPEEVKAFLYQVEKYNFDKLPLIEGNGQLQWVGSQESEKLNKKLEEALDAESDSIDELSDELNASLENDFNEFIKAEAQKLVNDILKHGEAIYADYSGDNYLFKSESNAL